MLCCYRIICVTGRISEATNGSVTVTIGDQTSVAINSDVYVQSEFLMLYVKAVSTLCIYQVNELRRFHSTCLYDIFPLHIVHSIINIFVVIIVVIAQLFFVKHNTLSSENIASILCTLCSRILV